MKKGRQEEGKGKRQAERERERERDRERYDEKSNKCRIEGNRDEGKRERLRLTKYCIRKYQKRYENDMTEK